jgi:hypothetical protein
MNRWLTGILSITFMLFNLAPAIAQEDKWPRTLPLDEGLVTIYAPQVDKMSGNTLYYRAALAYREKAGAEPVFGAGWFESTIEIDNLNRIVRPIDFKTTETRFPDGTPDITSALTTGLASQSAQWNLDFSLDELDAALKTAEAQTNAAEKLNTQPPDIIYRDHPALLITMDGQPVLREIENSPYQAVINTPYPLIYNNQHFYLNAAKDVWYRADKATGPYRFDANPPTDLAAMVKDEESKTAAEASTEIITSANAPEIIVSTLPAELLVTDGPAAFVPLVDDLMVLENSDNDVFMHINSQAFYIVLAGRWYHANSLNGPWSYQAADELPIAFANIPRDSEQADSRVYVAGTEEAREAILDAEVPQTAAVQRGKADIDVEYDGEPEYASVDGTDLVYIRNTGSTVLMSDGLFYLVENGVWYVSATANGPWQVSDHRPQEVETILPTSPVYNSKYVHVYDSTPNVVYVGYTPGYTGSYVYHNTILYGTGWHYRPWVSPRYYYPRHSTWGFSVAYNSWSGWNFGLGWAWGPFSVGYYPGGYWHQSHYWHHRHYGHWGPRGYRARPAHYRRGGQRYAHDNHRSNNNGRNDNGRDNYARNDQSGRDDRNSRNNGDRRDRNDNLYRGDSQRANVANTRDRQATDTQRRNNSTRQANNSGARGTPQKNYAGTKKGERNRAGPVSTSDLRQKATIRDINRIDVKRGNLLADNNGDIYTSPGRQSNRSAPVRQRDLAAKRPDRQSRSSTSTRKQNPSQTTQPVYGYSSGKSKRSSSKNKNQQRVNSSVQTPVRQSNPVRGNTSSKSRQRQSNTVTRPSPKQRVATPNTRLKSSQSSVRSQPQTSRSTAKNQRSQPRPVAKPQNASRKQPTATQSSRNSARKSSASPQNTNKRSSQKTSNTESKTGKRAKNNRSKR